MFPYRVLKNQYHASAELLGIKHIFLLHLPRQFPGIKVTIQELYSEKTNKQKKNLKKVQWRTEIYVCIGYSKTEKGSRRHWAYKRWEQEQVSCRRPGTAVMGKVSFFFFVFSK